MEAIDLTKEDEVISISSTSEEESEVEDVTARRTRNTELTIDNEGDDEVIIVDNDEEKHNGQEVTNGKELANNLNLGLNRDLGSREDTNSGILLAPINSPALAAPRARLMPRFNCDTIDLLNNSHNGVAHSESRGNVSEKGKGSTMNVKPMNTSQSNNTFNYKGFSEQGKGSTMNVKPMDTSRGNNTFIYKGIEERKATERVGGVKDVQLAVGTSVQGGMEDTDNKKGTNDVDGDSTYKWCGSNVTNEDKVSSEATKVTK